MEKERQEEEARKEEERLAKLKEEEEKASAAIVQVKGTDTNGAVIFIIFVICLAVVAAILVFCFRDRLGLGDKCNCFKKKEEVQLFREYIPD